MGLNEFCANTPWWVYFIFLYLLVLGWISRRPRIIALARIFIVPALLSIWSLHILYSRYTVTLEHSGVWIFSTLLGTWAGWWTFYHMKITADKRKHLVRLPGGWTPLFLIVLVFVIRYYFTLMHAKYPPTLTSPLFIYSDLILTSFIIGLFVGRGFRVLRDYRKAPHTDLHRF